MKKPLKLHLKDIKNWLIDYLRVVFSALKKIGSDNISILASGMVYSTLIAIVPCITFLLFFLSAFGASEGFLQDVERWLIETFGTSEGKFVLEKLTVFSKNAMSLGIAGLVSFIITGLLLAGKVDSVINNIFRTRPSSGLMKRYGKIFIFLIVLTVVIALSLSLASAIREKAYSFMGIKLDLGIAEILMDRWGRYGLIFLLFFFLLYFIPNVRVNFSSAIAGSILGTVTMSLFYLIFTNLITTTVKYSVIYGSLAAILLVLLFLYVTWYIIIIVAETTYIYQFRPENGEENGFPLTPERELEEGLRILKQIAISFEKGEGGIDGKLLSSRSRVTYYRTDVYLKVFIESGFIKEVSSASFILSRPSEKIMLSDVVEALFSRKRKSTDPSVTLFLNKGLSGIKGISIKDYK